jgi:hypothetical protein
MDRCGEIVLDERSGRAREQDLAAVPRSPIREA